MNKRLRTRFLIIAAITILSVALFAGFPPSFTKMKDKIRLGLDLKGGTHLVLQVVTDDAIRAETDQTLESLRQQLQRENIVFRQLTRSQNNEFKAVGVDTAKDADFRRILGERFLEWDLVSTSGDVPNTYTMRLKTANEQAFRTQAVDQAINTIRNRIDQLGVGEVVIQKHGGPGEDEVLVQLPGMDDPARVKGIMQSTALLELKLVDSGPFASQALAAQNYGGAVPAHLEVLPSVERDIASSAEATYYAVQRVASVSGRDLKGAYSSRDENGRPAVSFNLTADGASRFGRVTEENVGKMLAIVLDGRIQSAPRINSRITDSGVITGGAAGFSPQASQDLALVLRSGALPASIKYLDEEVVGPSLGADSVRAGLTAAVVALLSVIVFMLFYYKLSGVNATIAISESRDLVGRHGVFRGHINFAGHRWNHSHDRRRHRFQCFDFRAHPRGASCGQDCGDGGHHQLQAGVHHSSGHASGGIDFGDILISLRNRRGEGFCGHIGDRLDFEHVYGGFCVQDLIRMGSFSQRACGNY
jgi:preprotein translocase subunit SecD